MDKKILIIDDELQIRRLIRVTLQAHGYTTVEAGTGKEGLLQATMHPVDLIILDLGLPDLHGVQVVEQIREWSSVPVIILTVHDDEESKIFALDNGADDYVTKPFGMGELMARIRVALRHKSGKSDEPFLEFGHVTMDLAHRLVRRDGEVVRLTPIEYDLLKTLAVHAGRVLTHRQLLKEVWGDLNYQTANHYLRVYVGHLRKKLEYDPTRPSLIITEPGVGYRLICEE